MKCIIVDDEELARKLIESYIQKLEDLELLGSFKNPEHALTFMEENEIDLIFLDIQMPELTGIEFVKRLNKKPHVIFTTAYNNYAMEGFELDVSDYLLKPFSFERFHSAVSKVEEYFKLTEKLKHFEQEADVIAKEILLVKSEHKIHRIPIANIHYIQSMREYVAYYMDSGRILSLNSLKKLELELAPNGFIRIHKSYLIDGKKVQMLDGNALHINGEKLPIGASYKEKVVKALFQ